MAGAPGRQFSFNGERREALPDETLLDALSHERVPVLLRSIRYHRPRAPACGLGYCTGCLVRVNGRPNVRACRHLPANGDAVVTENAWPSTRFDLLGALDYLFPGGLDTLHGFRRPVWATRAYHRVVRRLAGYGTAPTLEAARALSGPAVHRSVDIAIVGGGASGRATAARLAAAGARPVVLDRELSAANLPGADLLDRTTATFLPPRASPDTPFTLLGFMEPGRGVEVRAQRVVVATGGYDAALGFVGNDRPGVLTADGAFALARGGRRPPFSRAVVVGGGARADAVLERLGDSVEAVIAPTSIVPNVTRRASELSIPLYPRTLVLGASGRARVRSLQLRSRGTGTAFSLNCDAVVLAHRRLPSAQLFFQVGARMEWRPTPGAYFPVVSAVGETSVPGLYAVGEGAGALGPEVTAGAERTADHLLGHPPTVAASPSPGGADGPSELEGYYREVLDEPRRGKWVACPCEDVLVQELEEANRAGYCGIEVVKRYTGLGTGLCQGRYCLPDALLLLAILERRTPREVGYITQRPPVSPTPLAAFAAIGDPPFGSGGP
jgi:sarcosine oxidase, subunit alpha